MCKIDVMMTLLSRGGKSHKRSISLPAQDCDFALDSIHLTKYLGTTLLETSAHPTTPPEDIQLSVNASACAKCLAMSVSSQQWMAMD